MNCAYDPNLNQHSLVGAATALSAFFENEKPLSILDVGCGPALWLKAASAMGVDDLHGIDFNIPDRLDTISVFQQVDLTKPWNLGRKFDLILCLEVAEHLPPGSASDLIKSLTDHGSRIFFSAACPGQSGQNHVNCQWPEYWQALFNSHGFVCDDSIRWRIWDQTQIEPWYRQNIFFASQNSELAGEEPRIAPVVHPGIAEEFRKIPGYVYNAEYLKYLQSGQYSFYWYLKALLNAVGFRFRR